MKKIKIQVIFDENKLAMKVDDSGLQKGIPGIMELVGILENLKQSQLDKLNTLLRKEKNG